MDYSKLLKGCSYICNICSKNFVKKADLEIHYNVHKACISNIEYYCSKCKNVFKTNAELVEHTKLLHPKSDAELAEHTRLLAESASGSALSQKRFKKQKPSASIKNATNNCDSKIKTPVQSSDNSKPISSESNRSRSGRIIKRKIPTDFEYDDDDNESSVHKKSPPIAIDDSLKDNIVSNENEKQESSSSSEELSLESEEFTPETAVNSLKRRKVVDNTNEGIKSDDSSSSDISYSDESTENITTKESSVKRKIVKSANQSVKQESSSSSDKSSVESVTVSHTDSDSSIEFSSDDEHANAKPASVIVPKNSQNQKINKTIIAHKSISQVETHKSTVKTAKFKDKVEAEESEEELQLHIVSDPDSDASFSSDSEESEAKPKTSSSKEVEKSRPQQTRSGRQIKWRKFDEFSDNFSESGESSKNEDEGSGSDESFTKSMSDGSVSNDSIISVSYHSPEKQSSVKRNKVVISKIPTQKPALQSSVEQKAVFNKLTSPIAAKYSTASDPPSVRYIYANAFVRMKKLPDDVYERYLEKGPIIKDSSLKNVELTATTNQDIVSSLIKSVNSLSSIKRNVNNDATKEVQQLYNRIGRLSKLVQDRKDDIPNLPIIQSGNKSGNVTGVLENKKMPKVISVTPTNKVFTVFHKDKKPNDSSAIVSANNNLHKVDKIITKPPVFNQRVITLFKSEPKPAVIKNTVPLKYGSNECIEQNKILTPVQKFENNIQDHVVIDKISDKSPGGTPKLIKKMLDKFEEKERKKREKYELKRKMKLESLRAQKNSELKKNISENDRSAKCDTINVGAKNQIIAVEVARNKVNEMSADISNSNGADECEDIQEVSKVSSTKSDSAAASNEVMKKLESSRAPQRTVVSKVITIPQSTATRNKVITLPKSTIAKNIVVTVPQTTAMNKFITIPSAAIGNQVMTIPRSTAVRNVLMTLPQSIGARNLVMAMPRSTVAQNVVMSVSQSTAAKNIVMTAHQSATARNVSTVPQSTTARNAVTTVPQLTTSKNLVMTVPQTTTTRNLAMTVPQSTAAENVMKKFECVVLLKDVIKNMAPSKPLPVVRHREAKQDYVMKDIEAINTLKPAVNKSKGVNKPEAVPKEIVKKAIEDKLETKKNEECFKKENENLEGILKASVKRKSIELKSEVVASSTKKVKFKKTIEILKSPEIIKDSDISKTLKSLEIIKHSDIDKTVKKDTMQQKGLSQNDSVKVNKASVSISDAKKKIATVQKSTIKGSIGVKDKVASYKKIGRKILKMDNLIKISLSVSSLNINLCLKAMNWLDDLKIHEGIWKKCLVILKTIKKCRKFKGSEAVRQKANHLYKKFIHYFMNPAELKLCPTQKSNEEIKNNGNDSSMKKDTKILTPVNLECDGENKKSLNSSDKITSPQEIKSTEETKCKEKMKNVSDIISPPVDFKYNRVANNISPTNLGKNSDLQEKKSNGGVQNNDNSSSMRNSSKIYGVTNLESSTDAKHAVSTNSDKIDSQKRLETKTNTELKIKKKSISKTNKMQNKHSQSKILKGTVNTLNKDSLITNRIKSNIKSNLDTNDDIALSPKMDKDVIENKNKMPSIVEDNNNLSYLNETCSKALIHQSQSQLDKESTTTQNDDSINKLNNNVTSKLDTDDCIPSSGSKTDQDISKNKNDIPSDVELDEIHSSTIEINSEALDVQSQCLASKDVAFDKKNEQNEDNLSVNKSTSGSSKSLPSQTATPQNLDINENSKTLIDQQISQMECQCSDHLQNLIPNQVVESVPEVKCQTILTEDINKQSAILDKSNVNLENREKPTNLDSNNMSNDNKQGQGPNKISKDVNEYMSVLEDFLDKSVLRSVNIIKKKLENNAGFDELLPMITPRSDVKNTELLADNEHDSCQVSEENINEFDKEVAKTSEQSQHRAEEVLLEKITESEEEINEASDQNEQDSDVQEKMNEPEKEANEIIEKNKLESKDIFQCKINVLWEKITESNNKFAGTLKQNVSDSDVRAKIKKSENEVIKTKGKNESNDVFSDKIKKSEKVVEQIKHNVDEVLWEKIIEPEKEAIETLGKNQLQSHETLPVKVSKSEKELIGALDENQHESHGILQGKINESEEGTGTLKQDEHNKDVILWEKIMEPEKELSETSEQHQYDLDEICQEKINASEKEVFEAPQHNADELRDNSNESVTVTKASDLQLRDNVAEFDSEKEISKTSELQDKKINDFRRKDFVKSEQNHHNTDKLQDMSNESVEITVTSELELHDEITEFGKEVIETLEEIKERVVQSSYEMESSLMVKNVEDRKLSICTHNKDNECSTCSMFDQDLEISATKSHQSLASNNLSEIDSKPLCSSDFDNKKQNNNIPIKMLQSPTIVDSTNETVS